MSTPIIKRIDTNEVLYVGDRITLSAVGATSQNGSFDPGITTANAVLDAADDVPADFSGGAYTYVRGLWVRTADGQASYEAAQAEKARALQEGFTASVQASLDAFASARGYDNMVSLCTYVTSTNPQFAAEGQRGVDMRDQSWAAGYAYMAAVQAGQKPVPTSVADAIAAAGLPDLTWTN